MNPLNIKRNRLIIAAIVLLTGCTNKKGKLVPQNMINSSLVCDTTNVGYTCTVKPILKSNCYSCHSSSTCNGGLDIENFQSFKNYLNYFYKNDSIYGSKFYHIILQSQGVLPMPPVGKLSPEEIHIIGKWIAQGALEN